MYSDFFLDAIHVFLRDSGHLHNFTGVNFVDFILGIRLELGFANFAILTYTKYLFYIYQIAIYLSHLG